MNPVTATEAVEPVVGRSVTLADSTINDEQSADDAAVVMESASVQQELMVVDSYYGDSTPADGWTPKSLLESPTSSKVQDDVVTSSEATKTGRLQQIPALNCE